MVVGQQQQDALMDENTCPNCGIPVYQAEALLAGNCRWHKRCFKCCWCNKFLNTSNCNVHQGFLFCKHCLNEVTKYDRPQIYPDTSLIQAADQHHVGSGSGCPRCGGAVFEAEKVVEKGRTYHKRCFTCSKCNRPQDDKLQVFIGFDDQVYCRVCYPNITHTPLPADPRDTAKIRAEVGDASGCPRCGGKVFEAEKVSAGHGVYHKRCFSCRMCFKPMDALGAVSHQNEVFCKSCYHNHFDSRSKSIGPGDTSLIRGHAGGRDTCPRCHGLVFEAEKVGARHFDFHKRCLDCKHCGQKLDASSFCDAPDGDVYCKGCYAVSFGHRSRAKSVGPADTRAIGAPEGSIAKCPGCGGMVFEAEKRVSRQGWYHPSCFKCSQCTHCLDPTSFNDGPDGKIYCGGCYKTLRLMDINQTAKSVVETTAVPAMRGDKDACPKCGGKVFEAEKMVAKRGMYHKKCFTCSTCHRALDSLIAVDSPMGDIHCQPCYKKQFGPTEIRVLSADERATDTTLIKPFDSHTLGCPRCGGAVFEAEKVMSNGFAFHTKCTSCRVCSKKLDSSSLCSLSAKDPDLYCKGCMGRLTGGTGYRGSIGGQWIDEKTSSVLRPTQYINPALMKAAQGEVACKKCQGKVFELERICSKMGTYHKQCFNCEGCKKTLDSTLVYNYEAQDGGIYCKRCFTDRFGEGTKPLTYSDTSLITACDGTGCPRCGGAVFEAEKLAANNRNFHRSCATCRSCSHKLDASSLCCGSDGDIYCEGCYSRAFGGAGYRRGNNWLDERSNIRLRPCQNVDTRSVQVAAGDPDACRRCHGKVYDLEKVSSKTGTWHKQCFNCKSCNSTLTSTLLYGFEAPDSEVYCKGCFVRNFGEGTKPLDYSNTGLIKASSGEHGCPRCGGTVFEAEKIVAGENVWFHKGCFDCQMCHTKLDSVRSAIGNNGDAYCSSCYKHQLEAERARANVAKPRTMIRAEAGDPTACPRCRGKVFEAEKIVAGENVWFHKGCFDCQICHTKLDSVRSAIGNDGDAYCSSCYKSELQAERARRSVAKPNTMIPAEPGDPTACPRCNGKVFEAEKLMSRDRMFHKECFTCLMCHHKLDVSGCMAGPNSEVYCKTCYVKEYFTGGRNKFGDMRGSAPGGDRDGCLKCRQQVFEVDKVIAKAGPVHKQCLICGACNRKLDSTSYCDAGSDLFCQNCYGERFGVRGKSSCASSGRVDTNRLLATEGDTSRCPRCSGKVFEAEMMRTSAGPFHPACFKCRKCASNLDQSSVSCGPDGDIYCTLCYKEDFGVLARRGRSMSRSRPASGIYLDQDVMDGSDDIVAKSVVDTQTIMAEAGDKDACPRCRGKVFPAEKMTSNNGVYHKKCFTCGDCHRALDASLVCDGPNAGEIFCRNCYSKRFGPTANRVFDEASARKGLTAGTPMDASKACGRCSGAVFANEEVSAGGRVFHLKCAKCKGCDRKLDAGSICMGEDKDIYCQGCASRTFGTAGYRGTQSTAWMDQDTTNHRNSTHFNTVITDISSTTQLFKTVEGDKDACIRCQGKVFDAEKIISSSGLFHKTCFKCLDCGSILDATKACEGESAASGGRREVFCRACYGRNCGLHGYGHGGFGSIPALTAGGGESKSEYHFTQFF